MINLSMDKDKVYSFTASGDVTTLAGEILEIVVMTGMTVGDVDEFWNSVQKLLGDNLVRYFCKNAVKESLQNHDVIQVTEDEL